MDRQQEAELLSQIRADAERIALAFRLSYRGIVAEHPRVKRRYGACYADGLIAIRLKHATTVKPLKYSSLMDTLCHELAHLRHFNHGPQFKSFFLELLGWARRHGIYCPGPRGATRGPAHGLFAPPAEALAAALRPPRRNGVPVFPKPPAVEAQSQQQLPWERWAGAAPEAASPRRQSPSKRRRARQPSSSREAVASQQLALF
jgi:hypothetical protein